MFKKITTTKLLVILVILGGIASFNKFYQSKKDENTFRNEFVKIDTSAVTGIYIYPRAENGKEIKITKNGRLWDLQNDKIKTIADSNIVRSFLSEFAAMKSLSLAGQDKSTWKDLQVTDSTGTRIKIITAGESYDMIVGKFGYNQQTGSGLTNIRHTTEEEVYAVQSYLSYSVNQPFNSWRNKIFIKGNKESWTTLTFTYPSDSSFILGKSSGNWMVNGEVADSVKVSEYLNQLASIQGNGFVDEYVPSSTPVYSISINGNNQSSPINIHAFPSDSTKKFILHSSVNPEAYFNDAESRLAERIFKGKSFFLIGD